MTATLLGIEQRLNDVGERLNAIEEDVKGQGEAIQKIMVRVHNVETRLAEVENA